MNNKDCPYEKQFKDYWDKKGVSKAFSDVKEVNKNIKSYKKINQMELI